MNERFSVLLRRAVLGALAAAALCAGPARAQTLPTSISATPVGVSSITVSWSGDTMTVYQLLSSTGYALSSPMTGLVSYSTTSFPAFSTNTLVTFMIQASSGASVKNSATSSLYTQAAQPSGSVLLSVNGTQAIVNWETNGNPYPQTNYAIDWYVSGSTAIVFSTQPVVVTGSATATISNLPALQTVYFEVQSFNGDGVASPFDVLLATVTGGINGQNAISSGTYALGISSIAWYWSASTGAINYQLFEDSAVAASPLLGPNQLSYAQTGLTPNTLYQDYIQSYSLTSSTNSAPFSRYTLAKPTTGLTLLNLSTGTATETLSWGANGNPPSTTYLVQWWTTLTSTITVSTQATTASISNLSGGAPVYFTVQAKNGDGILADFDKTLYNTVPSTSFPVGILNVPQGYQGTMTFVLPAAAVSLTFSSNTFTSPVSLTVTQTAAAASAPPNFTSAGNVVPFQIKATDANGVTQNPVLSVIVTVRYVNSQLNGIDPGTLSLAYDDPAHGWVALAAARDQKDAAINSVVNSFGYFQLFGVSAATDLSEITVGPNPLRPTLNAGQVMTFRNLPQGTRVRIFTYLGEKIADIAADQSGIAAWDGHNASGYNVASGVYLAVIQGAGVKKVMRVAIER